MLSLLVIGELVVLAADPLLADPLVADPLVVVEPFAVVGDEVAVVACPAAVEFVVGVPDAGEDVDDLLADPPQEASANAAITIKAALIQFVLRTPGSYPSTDVRVSQAVSSDDA